MAIELVTGRAGTAHITSDQLGAGYASLAGPGQYRGSTGSQMQAALADSNTVRVSDGEAWFNGRHVTIPYGTYEDVAIDSGAQGKNRIDLVVIRYERNASTGVEAVSLIAIKGTPSSGAPTQPAYNAGTVMDGSIAVDMPLCSVYISGIAPSAPTMIPPVLETISGLQSGVAEDGLAIASLQGDVASIKSDTGWLYLVGSADDLSGNYARWRAKGETVFIQAMLRRDLDLASSGSRTIGTIPEGYRPDANVETAAYLGASNGFPGTIWVTAGGDVVIGNSASGKVAGSLYATLEYPLG